jgi:hypothetical protein
MTHAPDPNPSPAPLGQGAVVPAADPEELRRALDEAFDYRGDVTLVLRDGSSIEGFLFDRRSGRTLADSRVRLLPKTPIDGVPSTDPKARIELSYADIAELRFTGRDTAAGKTWENWVRRYAEKKLKGEHAEIASEALD